jgi:hypothetical protein
VGVGGGSGSGLGWLHGCEGFLEGGRIEGRVKCCFGVAGGVWGAILGLPFLVPFLNVAKWQKGTVREMICAGTLIDGTSSE